MRQDRRGQPAAMGLLALMIMFFSGVAAQAAPSGLEFYAADLDLVRDRHFPPQEDPGKFRREILLTGDGGGVYLMAWDLTRLNATEWLERALGPVLQGSLSWAWAWIPGADFSAVVEVPATDRSSGMRVYAVRLGDTGVAALCYGVEDPGLSAACDRVAGSLEVRP